MKILKVYNGDRLIWFAPFKNDEELLQAIIDNCNANPKFSVRVEVIQ